MNKKILNMIGTLLTIVSFVFIFLWVKKNPIKVFELNWKSISSIIINVIFFSLNVIISSIAWNRILSFLANKKVSVKKSLVVFANTNIAKYLPGNVFQYASRNVMGTELGLTQSKLAMSSLIEIILVLFSAFLWVLILGNDKITFLLTYLFDTYGKYINIIITILIIIAIVILLIVFLLRNKILKIIKKFKSVAKDYFISIEFLKTSLFCFFMYSITFFFSAIGLYLIMSNVYPGNLSMNELITVISSYIIAWVMGYMVIGSPGGVGVRELLLGVFLMDMVTKSILGSAILLNRAVSIIGDVLVYLVVKLVLYIKAKNK